MLLTSVELASAYCDIDPELIEINEGDGSDERNSDDAEDELEPNIIGSKDNLSLIPLDNEIKKISSRNIDGLSYLFISPIHEPPEL